jgi:Cu2+-exporting ATPase
MPTCVHCATPFSASSELEKFCCRGCEYVYDLIHDEGLDRFYDLRSSSTIRPVRSLPFEERDFEWLKEEVQKVEATAPDGTEVRAEFSMEGISCVGCVWLIEKIFLKYEGAIEAAAHPATGQLQLKWVSGKTDLCGFTNEIAGFGYMLLKHRGSGKKSETRELGVKLGLCAAFMLNAMVFTLPSYVGMPADFAFAGIFKLVTFLSATLSMMVGGSYFINRAWHAVRARTIHIDLPIALGISFAFAGSIYGWAKQSEGLLYFDFVSTFIFLMLAGRYLQLSALEKNRNLLQRRRPVPDQIISPDHHQPICLSEIKAGLRIEISPGQSVPVASLLETPVSEFSLEWINGEAEPVTFRSGRPLPAGAIHLGNGPIIVVASETWDESLLSRLTESARPSSLAWVHEPLGRHHHHASQLGRFPEHRRLRA